MTYYLSIDYGGTNTKAIIFDEKGKQVAVSSFQTLRIEDKVGYREVDLTETWEAISRSIREALETSGLAAEAIKAVACIGHGKGLYVLNRDGKAFMRGILSTDSRAQDLAATFEAQVSQIWPKTRQHVVGVQNPVLLRWLKEHDPSRYEQIGHILSAKDFVRFKLTGTINQEYGDASGNHWINFETGTYDKTILDFFGIGELFDCLPPLIDYKDVAGYLTAEAAAQTGLAVGTPVIGGLFDIDACALGSGVLKEDTLSVIAGTWNINTYPSKVPAHQDSGLMNSYFPTKEFLVEASSPTSAGNLDLMLKMLMSEEIKQADGRIYDVLEEFLENTDASFSKVLFFPFLYGSNSHPSAQSSFFGLSSKTTKSEMIRAVYEGIVFAHYQHIQQMLTDKTTPTRLIRLSGGGTNSLAWCQLFADVIGLPVEVLDASELGGLGGVISCAVAIEGLSLEESVSRYVHVTNRLEPSVTEHEKYIKKYRTYQTFLKALEPAWKSLKTLSEL